MASVDMCEHDWAGSGCKECRLERLKSRVDELESELIILSDNAIRWSGRWTEEKGISDSMSKVIEAGMSPLAKHRQLFDEQAPVVLTTYRKARGL